MAATERECRKLLYQATERVVKNVNTKTEKKQLNYLRQSKSNQETKANDESDLIKLENVRSFASIIIELYFSKQENKKL